MEPVREVFWNIQLGIVMELLAAGAVGVSIYALYRRVQLWRLGLPDDRFSQFGKRI